MTGRSDGNRSSIIFYESMGTADRTKYGLGMDLRGKKALRMSLRFVTLEIEVPFPEMGDAGGG